MESKFRVFTVNDYRGYNNKIDILLFDNSDCNPSVFGDAIGCKIDVNNLFDSDNYEVQFFNDVDGTFGNVPDDERAEIIKVVNSFLLKNPIDTMKFNQLY